MKRKKVALIKCESYEPEAVYSALCKGFSLLDFNFSVFRDKEILIKPNLCLPIEYNKNITTHPEIVRQLSLILNDTANSITIGDTAIGAVDAEREVLVWEKTGMLDLLHDSALTKDNLNKDLTFVEADIYNEKMTLPISRTVLRKRVINVPKMKTHGYMMLSGCIKNMYGILAGDAKKEMHSKAKTKKVFASLLQYIYNLTDCRLNIVDAVVALEGEGPGVLGVPRNTGLIVMGEDGYAVDVVLTWLMKLNIQDVLTNVGDMECIKIVGEEAEAYREPSFLLPPIDDVTDRKIQHIIQSKKSKLTFDKNKCVCCNLCLENCPKHAIHMDVGSYSVDKEKCILCLVCVETCLKGAISTMRNTFFKRGY